MIQLTRKNAPLALLCNDEVRASLSSGVFVSLWLGESRCAVLHLTEWQENSGELLSKLLHFCATQRSDIATAQMKMVGFAPTLNQARAWLRDAALVPCVVRELPPLPPGAVAHELCLNTQSGLLRVDLATATSVTAATSESQKVRVLIVDDSDTVRKLLRKIFSADPSIEVVGDIANPLKAEEAITNLKPDVVSLDIHMPEMDGITLLQKLVTRFKIPCIMVSTISYEEGTRVLKALELGAFDYIEKPTMAEFEEKAEIFREKFKAAGRSKLNLSQRLLSAPLLPLTFRPDVPILIGTSTGGPEALRILLTALPKEIPPILIVQHIPPVFSAALAKRLSELCAFEVREAVQGDALAPGLALLAPGGFQMSLEGRGMFSRVRISPGPKTLHMPNVDILFKSATAAFGHKAVAALLTGMGKDGAEGLLALKQAGVATVAEAESSCVVFGMPRVAIEMGAADHVLALDKIPKKLSELSLACGTKLAKGKRAA